MKAGTRTKQFHERVIMSDYSSVDAENNERQQLSDRYFKLHSWQSIMLFVLGACIVVGVAADDLRIFYLWACALFAFPVFSLVFIFVLRKIDSDKSTWWYRSEKFFEEVEDSLRFLVRVHELDESLAAPLTVGEKLYVMSKSNLGRRNRVSVATLVLGILGFLIACFGFVNMIFKISEIPSFELVFWGLFISIPAVGFLLWSVTLINPERLKMATELLYKRCRNAGL